VQRQSRRLYLARQRQPRGPPEGLALLSSQFWTARFAAGQETLFALVMIT
jgi:hypothetical protein